MTMIDRIVQSLFKVDFLAENGNTTTYDNNIGFFMI